MTMRENKMDIARHLIDSGSTLKEAFSRLNDLSGSNMTLFVIDPAGRLLGSLTDGDLRRALISDTPLDSLVGNACHKGCMSLREGEDHFLGIKEARQRRIELLPVIGEDGIISRLIDLTHIKNELPLDAVMMAGGKGERLRPLTLDCPKPLLKVGDKAIIDYNIEELFSNGIDNIFVTVNYLKEQIINHFSDLRFGGKVKCVEEPRRLGTMGSLSLVEGLSNDNLIVMNSDLLTTIDFEKMLLQHLESEAVMTIGVIPYSVSIPFAIIKSEGKRITGLTEKPTYNYFANGGVYMMRREVAESIPKGEYLDAPDLIERLIGEGQKVEYFPIEGTWIDVGSPDDYRYANDFMRALGK